MVLSRNEERSPRLRRLVRTHVNTCMWFTSKSNNLLSNVMETITFTQWVKLVMGVYRCPETGNCLQMWAPVTKNITYKENNGERTTRNS